MKIKKIWMKSGQNGSDFCHLLIESFKNDPQDICYSTLQQLLPIHTTIHYGDFVTK